MSRRLRAVLAWGVHFYTALGLACAAGMAVLIVRGDEASFRGAFWLMGLATLIDATDGALARLFRVKEILPGFDGRKLDDLVDFLTYVSLPLLLIWRAKLIPEGTEALLLLPLFAAAYGFCQAQAKTDDGYFLGFPSYWNLVAFYLYVLPWADSARLGLIIVPALLTFVPTLYLYPTQKGRLNQVTNLLAGPWTVLLALTLWRSASDDGQARTLALISLYFPIWYLAASWWISFRRLIAPPARRTYNRPSTSSPESHP
jgi:phosphatidylcholine synthase